MTNTEQIAAMAERIEKLEWLLWQASQYVSDAGDDESPETQRLSGTLLGEIRALLSSGDQG